MRFTIGAMKCQSLSEDNIEAPRYVLPNMMDCATETEAAQNEQHLVTAPMVENPPTNCAYEISLASRALQPPTTSGRRRGQHGKGNTKGSADE